MVYRAKCTHIPSHTTDIYYLENKNFVTDKTDIYIEVNSAEEAEMIEDLDRLYVSLFQKRLALFNFRKGHHGNS